MKKVVIGLSGGVDSSVAAYLLKKQGYDVIGATMQIWQEDVVDSDKETGITAIDDARHIANQLDIPYHVINFNEQFKEKVISYFIDEYIHGRTPNPCIVCNRCVKWEALLEWAKEQGADYVATGHYARVVKLDNGRYTLSTSATLNKDQTYALYNLDQYQLEHTLMPVGDYTKDEIRVIAEEIGLDTASKPDSMEICFIPDGDYAKYICDNSSYIDRPGNFVTIDGEVLGRHQGIIHYTIGQRKGLNIAFGKPMYVIKIDVERNVVVLGNNDDVFKGTLYCNRINLMAIDNIEDNMVVTAKIRYNHAGDVCRIKKIDEDLIEVVFDKPQRAVTPGQAVVFYKGNLVIGGGTII